MAQFRLLALDLDGTLLDDRGVVSPENARALRLAQQAGVQLVLCTGRGLSDACMFNDELLVPADWAVTANGADVRAFSDNLPVFSCGLDEALCSALSKVCRQFDGEPCFYTNENMYYGDSLKGFIDSLRRFGHQTDFLELEHYHYIPNEEAMQALIARERGRVTKAILYHNNPAAVDCMIDMLERDGRFELAPSSMFGGRLKNVEVNRAGVHKGSGLAALANYLGCGMEQVLAIGDSDNDVTMLQMAGLGVAMENAAPHIRQTADAITASNTAHGVAHAVTQYILEEGV